MLLSTHIVEDVAQTCRSLAVLAKGRVVFTGDVTGLVAVAGRSVWTTAQAPETGTVVSALPHGDGMRYRVVSPVPPDAWAQPAEPTLEDGYLALMLADNVMR